jgi:hypothetical protein
MLDKLKELGEKEISKRFASNWYIGLGSANITVSFWAESEQGQAALIMLGLILIFWGLIWLPKEGD